MLISNFCARNFRLSELIYGSTPFSVLVLVSLAAGAGLADMSDEISVEKSYCNSGQMQIRLYPAFKPSSGPGTGFNARFCPR